MENKISKNITHNDTKVRIMLKDVLEDWCKTAIAFLHQFMSTLYQLSYTNLFLTPLKYKDTMDYVRLLR